MKILYPQMLAIQYVHGMILLIKQKVRAHI